MDRAVRLHEPLLDGVLCLVGGAADEVGRPEEDGLVPPNDLLIGVEISRYGSLDKNGIIQWTALHRSLPMVYTAARRMVPSREGQAREGSAAASRFSRDRKSSDSRTTHARASNHPPKMSEA